MIYKNFDQTNFDELEFQGRYAPLILAPAENSSLEPCPEGLTEVLWKD